MKMTEERLKGTIKQQLSTLKAPSGRPIRRITRSCILDHSEPDMPKPWLAALRMQQSIRCQYYRSIAQHPDQALDLTYALNCPPSGFEVRPYTRQCRKPNVCPWCFARRLEKVYRAIMETDSKIRNCCQLISWIRTAYAGDKLPFFRANYGPHQWFDAALTIQLVMPYFDARKDSFHLRHVGFQLIPKEEVLIQRKLARNCINPPIAGIYHSVEVTRELTYEVLARYTKLPWLDLYLSDNLDRFETIMNLYPRQKLLRISRSKPKGEKRGD